MINRDKKSVQLKVITDSVDAYGQLIPSEPINIDMALYTYQQSNTDDIRFTDVELVGITDANIKGGNIVVADGKEYMVKYVERCRLRTVAYLTKQGA